MFRGNNIHFFSRVLSLLLIVRILCTSTVMGTPRAAHESREQDQPFLLSPISMRLLSQEGSDKVGYRHPMDSAQRVVVTYVWTSRNVTIWRFASRTSDISILILSSRRCTSQSYIARCVCAGQLRQTGQRVGLYSLKI